MARYTIGLDYGTNTVRALLVNVADGAVLGTAIFDYPHGTAGVVLEPKDPNLARQFPGDYLLGAETTIKEVLAQGLAKGVKAEEVVGVGVDTTGSTPLPGG